MTVPAVAEAPARPTHLKLYEAGDELQAAYDLLTEFEGELTPEIEELLNQAQGNFHEKVERVALKVREFLANAAAAKSEADRLNALAKSHERAGESLKAYLHRELTRAGIQKVERPLAKVRIQKNGAPSVAQALTQDQLRALFHGPTPQFVRHIPESFALDAKAVVEEWKRDPKFTLDGVTIEQGTHLRIA